MKDLYQFDLQNRENGSYIIGIDEVGRGAIAGPLCVTAFTFFNYFLDSYSMLNDSKAIAFDKRKEIHNHLVRDQNCYFSFAQISSSCIDKINNISEATSRIMIEAIEKQISGISKLNKEEEEEEEKPRFVILIDGLKTAFKMLYNYLDNKVKENKNISYKYIVKGDQKSAAIAAASIISKVKRDEIMNQYHDQYPQYHFNPNRGYPTKYHKEMICKYGISSIHRKSFKPVRSIYQNEE